MKFLEKLDFFKPLGKGLAEVDTFMRREMPFNMSWGFPAAVLGASYFAPQILGAMGGSKAGAGTFSANNMLSSLGLEGGGSFVPTAGNSFTLPSSAYTPAYLNKLAQLQGVDAGDPTLFQRLTGRTEQGLYDAQQPFNTRGMLGRLLRNQMQQQAEQPSGPKYTSNVAQGFEYEDLNEPFRNPNASQQERSRKLLAQQLRLLNAYQPPASSGGSGMRTMNIQNLFDRFGTLS